MADAVCSLKKAEVLRMSFVDFPSWNEDQDEGGHPLA